MPAVAGSDLVGFQEVWHIEMLEQATARAGGVRHTILAPGATREENEETVDGKLRAIGPRVGLATRLRVLGHESIIDFPERAVFGVPTVDPETGRETMLRSPFTKFSRPVLKARVELPNGVPATVFVAHPRSKRPMLLEGEDQDDPAVDAYGAVRSLLLRGSEAAALRTLVLAVIDDPDEQRRGEPLIVLGDLNDDTAAVSTLAISGEPPYFRLSHERKRRVWDVLLYNAGQTGAVEPGIRALHRHLQWPPRGAGAHPRQPGTGAPVSGAHRLCAERAGAERPSCRRDADIRKEDADRLGPRDPGRRSPA